MMGMMIENYFIILHISLILRFSAYCFMAFLAINSTSYLNQDFVKCAISYLLKIIHFFLLLLPGSPLSFAILFLPFLFGYLQC